MSLSTGKSSTKQLPKATRGFGRAYSPCWLRKSQRKRSWCHLGNHLRNTFQRWYVDLEALTGACWLRKSQGKRSRCPLGNRHWNTFQRWRMDLEAPQPLLTTKKWTKQLPKVTRGFGRARSPCWLRKSQRKRSRWRLGNHHQNTFLRWRVDLEVPQLLLTKKMNETTSKGDAWIRKSSQPLLS